MRLLVGFVPAVLLLAQPQPDARTLLMQSGGSELLAGTVRLEGTETMEIQRQNGGGQSGTDSFSLERATGGRMRLEVTYPSSATMQLVADGQRVWTYFSNTHLYSQAPVAGTPMNDAYGRLLGGRDPATFRDARIERMESLSYSGKSVPCYVIYAAYQTMPGNTGVADITRTVWLAKDDSRVLRDLWEYRSIPDNPVFTGKVRVTTDYTVIESDVPIPDTLFVFRPPEGSAGIQATDAGAVAPVPKLGVRPAVQRAVTPEYTPEARAAGLQGVVSLYVEVRNDGHPRNVQVMQGLGLGLDDKAVAAVEQWQFAPKEGRPDATQSIFDVDVEFRLDQPGVWDVAGEGYYVTRPSTPKIQKIVKPVPSRYVAPDAAACQTASRPAVRFHVGVDGMPREVAGSLDAAAHAVESWQFQPATVDGNPAEADAEVEFTCTPGGMRLKSALEVLPVYRVGGGVSAPVLLSKSEPTYSEEARVARLQGTVRLSVHISPQGRATDIWVVEPLGMGLEEHAMEALKRWRFQPGKKAGEPVTVEATIEVNFRLL